MHACYGSFIQFLLGFPGGTMVQNLPAKAGDAREEGSISEWGRSPGLGNGNLLQYSCLGNFMDRGAWQAIVHGSQRIGDNLTTKQQ